jgi:hypothetical protein
VPTPVAKSVSALWQRFMDADGRIIGSFPIIWLTLLVAALQLPGTGWDIAGAIANIPYAIFMLWAFTTPRLKVIRRMSLTELERESVGVEGIRFRERVHALSYRVIWLAFAIAWCGMGVIGTMTQLGWLEPNVYTTYARLSDATPQISWYLMLTFGFAWCLQLPLIVGAFLLENRASRPTNIVAAGGVR